MPWNNKRDNSSTSGNLNIKIKVVCLFSILNSANLLVLCSSISRQLPITYVCLKFNTHAEATYKWNVGAYCHVKCYFYYVGEIIFKRHTCLQFKMYIFSFFKKIAYQNI